MKKYDYLSEEEQLELIKKNYYIIKDITNPSKEIQSEVTKNSEWVFMEMNNMDEEVQLGVIERNPDFIVFIDKPTKRVQLKAIEICNNIKSLKYLYDICKHLFTDDEAKQILRDKIIIYEILYG